MEQQVEPQPSTRVGALLRTCRLRAGLDLAEVAQSLRIRRPFLEAIESGRFEALPAPAYALGFVRCYAEQLGLDAEEIARRFKSEIADPGAGAPLHFPLPITAEGGAPKGAVLLLGAVIALGAYATWYITSSHRIDTAHIVSPVPDRLEQLLNAPGAASPAGGYPMPADRGPAPYVVPIVPMAPTQVRNTQVSTRDHHLYFKNLPNPGVVGSNPAGRAMISGGSPRSAFRACPSDFIDAKEGGEHVGVGVENRLDIPDHSAARRRSAASATAAMSPARSGQFIDSPSSSARGRTCQWKCCTDCAAPGPFAWTMLRPSG